MNKNWKWGAVSLGLIMGMQSSAFASRSIFYPNNSSDFSTSLNLKSDLAVLVDGKAETLKQSGVLLGQGQDASKLSNDDLNKLRITTLEIGYDDSSKKSFLGLKTDDGILGFGASEIKFALGSKIEIDSGGNPVALDGASGSAQTTGQGVGVQISESSPGAWIPYDSSGTEGCTYQVCHEECDRDRMSIMDADDHKHEGGDHPVCREVCTSYPGTQWYHRWGQTKSDGYTVTFDSAGTAGFELNYAQNYEQDGPCQ